MRAKTNGIRLITLSEGTLLVPTHDFVNITDNEATHSFTQRLVNTGEIELSESVVKENLTTETVEQSDAETELRTSLGEKTKSEILEILTAYGEEMSDRTTKDAMIEKVVEIARSNDEL